MEEIGGDAGVRVRGLRRKRAWTRRDAHGRGLVRRKRTNRSSGGFEGEEAFFGWGGVREGITLILLLIIIVYDLELR